MTVNLGYDEGGGVGGGGGALAYLLSYKTVYFKVYYSCLSLYNPYSAFLHSSFTWVS